MMQFCINQNLTIHKLQSNATLLLEPIEGFNSVSVSFFLKKGSRDETLNEAGFTHFAEHMLFKGTKSENKLSISQKFDKMGGHINAYTSQEEIVIYNRLPYFCLQENISLMCDMFNNSVFDENEITLEKDVILNELNSIYEDPQEKIFEDFYNNIFPDSGLGRPIIGNEDSINSVNKDKLFNFYNNFFSGEDLIVSIAGNFEENAVINQFENVNFRKCNRASEYSAPLTTLNSSFTKMNSELIHIVAGSVAFDPSPNFFVHLSLLSMLLGETMSSRLFQEVRDNLGLCYSINTQVHTHRKQILLTIYLSVLPSKLLPAVDAVSKVIDTLLNKGISEDELENAKQQKIGEIILSNDVLNKRMNSNIFYHLFYNNKINKKDIIKIINETTREDISKIIHLYFTNKFYTHSLYRKNIKDFKWKF